MHRRAIVPMLIGAIALGACGKKGPSPEELAQMRRDSIAAEQARLEAQRKAEEERRRREEERRRREAEERRRAMAAREAERARKIIAEMVHFAYDRSDIREEAKEVLIRKVAVLRANPEVKVRIAGHADERGSVEYNLALGKRRAEAVKEFLVGYGLDASRFETVSFGEERPIDPGHNEDAWAKNRRAEFTITAGDGQLKAPVSQ